MNNLYSLLGNNPANNVIQRFQQFQRTFRGDPKQQIQAMLNSGQITQAQFNGAVQMAKQLQGLLK